MDNYIADIIYLEKIYLLAIVSSVINYYLYWIARYYFNFDVLFFMLEAKFSRSKHNCTIESGWKLL